MKADETRARILDAAIEAFWTASYHATNMNALSRAAGLNKATVYQYYPSKEALAVASVARAADRTVEQVFEPAFEAHDDPIDRLRAIYARIYEMHETLYETDGLVRGCPFVNIGVELATANGAILDAVQAAFARFAVYYRRIVEDLRADGRLRPGGDTDDLVNDLLDNMNATLVASKLNRSPDVIPRGGERAVERLTT